MGSKNVNHLSIIESNFPEKVRKRSVFLEGGQTFYKNATQNPITKVTPYSEPGERKKAFENPKDTNSVIYTSLRPILTLLKIVGIFPISHTGQIFQVTPHLLGYSLGVFIVALAYIAFIRWGKLENVTAPEGRFEEAVIDYLFTVYLIPIIINIISWYEARKQARVLTKMLAFEKIYFRITKKKFVSILGHKPMIVTIALSILAITTMVITHITMVHFKKFKPLQVGSIEVFCSYLCMNFQVVPYCYINMVTYLLGGSWYIYCDLIGQTATTVANDFQQALRNVGPSSRISDYRSLWMMLSKIIRDVGNAFGYAMVFLCLYLFMIITLTVYGLLSQIQDGLGIKDIGLAITAFFAGTMLFFISDEAHYASNKVG